MSVHFGWMGQGKGVWRGKRLWKKKCIYETNPTESAKINNVYNKNP